MLLQQGTNLMRHLFLSLMIGCLSTSLAYASDWYKAMAEPTLVVRDAPDVTGNKIGNVPYGGKLSVLDRVGTQESIGGRQGQWAKVQWQGKTGYVFSAFIAPLESSSPSPTSTNNAGESEWFKSNAQPSLVVRSQPDVTGSKLGNVPYGGKIKIVKVVSKRESINGRTGRWVKISWQNTTGYVFDAYLEPADNLRTGINAVSASNQLDREIAMQLGLFTILAKEQGYSITHDLKQGQLSAGDSKGYALELASGTQYRILTACDKQCSDLDTRLLDENGNEVDADFSADDLPVLSIAPKWTGKFNLHIKMQNCTSATCHYGIAVFGL